MKHIVKGAEPPELAAWKAQWTGDGPAAKWDELSADVCRALKRALFADQGHICCYCGRRIVDNDSHIEHLVPRSPKTGVRALTFAWENLLASRQANLTRGDPVHCGTKKGDWYDAALMVSPLIGGCEARFHYELDGRIRASSEADLAASTTIERLDLDGPRLTGLRKGALEGLFALLDHELTPEEYEKLMLAYRERDTAGRYEPFCFALIAALDFFCAPPAEAPAASPARAD
jgi:uncharacterized protein (TIGR02646 family)